MDAVRPVHAHGERRGTDTHLVRRLDGQRLAGHRHRATVERLPEHGGDLVRRHPLLGFRGDPVDRLEQLAQSLALGGGGEAQGRVVEEGQPVAHLLDDLGLSHHTAWHEVPLVHDDDARAPGLVRVARDVRVLRGQPLGGVHDEQRHLRALETLERHDHRELLERLRHLALAPDAGGVDEHVGPALVDERRVHRVARGAGLIVDEHALGAQHRIDDRRLADVGAADHRDGDGLLAAGGRRGRGRAVAQRLEHLGDAAAVLARDAERIAEAESIEVGHRRLLAEVVHLVGDEHHRLVRLAQQPRDLFVERRRARPRVDDEGDEVGVVHRGQHLPAHALDERLGGAGIKAAGVDDRRLPALEMDLAVEAVAGHARRIAHDRLAASDEAVEQRGLADVRPANDRDYGAQHGRLATGARGGSGAPAPTAPV